MPDQTKNAAERNLDSRIIDVIIRLGFLGLLAYWTGLIVGPFVVIVVWAVILTVAVYPIYAWLKKMLGGRGSIATLIITLTFLAIILGPAGVLTSSLVETAEGLLASVKEGTLSIPQPADSVKDWPVIGGRIYTAWSEAAANVPAFIDAHQDTVASIARKAAGAAAGVGAGVLSFTVSVIISAFLYSGGPRMAESAGRFAERIASGRGREFIRMSGATIRNVARGVLGVSLIQALLAGIGMSLAGVPAAGLLTLVILILGILQAPPTLVIIPAIIWMWSDAEFVSALLFTAYMVPVALLDNFLKPILMAKGLKTPMLVIFIGVIGGTLAHGLIGLFLGPIILAVFYDLLFAWMGEGAAAPTQDERETAPETNR